MWTINTQPCKFAHFATFPEKLPELCIKAATPEFGCCSKCGKPWERIIEHKSIPTRPGYVTKREGQEIEIQGVNKKYRLLPEIETLGWQQACKCHDAISVPSTVLDPFCGSGTTLKVAAELNRHAVGYELSMEYCEPIVKRNKQGIIL